MPLSSFSSSYSSISVSVEKGALLKAGCTWKRDVRNTYLSPTSEGHGRLQIPTLCSWVHGLLRTFSSIWCTNVQWLKTIFSNYSGVWGGSWSLWPPPPGTLVAWMGWTTLYSRGLVRVCCSLRGIDHGMNIQYAKYFTC